MQINFKFINKYSIVFLLLFNHDKENCSIKE